jgi:hypothetical protein
MSRRETARSPVVRELRCKSKARAGALVRDQLLTIPRGRLASEQGGNSLYPSMAQRASSVEVLHIPDEADQRSGVMSITIPG